MIFKMAYALTQQGVVKHKMFKTANDGGLNQIKKNLL